jgi:hypothetical protein
MPEHCWPAVLRVSPACGLVCTTKTRDDSWILCFDYQGDYDLVLDLLDGAIPSGWACEHVGHKLDVERLERYFREHGGRHHALHDARANAFAFI